MFKRLVIVGGVVAALAAGTLLLSIAGANYTAGLDAPTCVVAGKVGECPKAGAARN